MSVPANVSPNIFLAMSVPRLEATTNTATAGVVATQSHARLALWYQPVSSWWTWARWRTYWAASSTGSSRDAETIRSMFEMEPRGDVDAVGVLEQGLDQALGVPELPGAQRPECY